MQTKINTLRELLPSSPFVAEQVGYALRFAQESGVDENKLVEILDQAIYLARNANKFSSPNFYNYKPIVCALLSVVTDSEKLETFATETNSVLFTLAQLKEFEKLLEENTVKACTYFCKAIIDKSDLPLLGFAWLINRAKNGTREEILQVAYIQAQIVISGFEFTGGTYEAYNDLMKALNKVVY